MNLIDSVIHKHLLLIHSNRIFFHIAIHHYLLDVSPYQVIREKLIEAEQTTICIRHGALYRRLRAPLSDPCSYPGWH